MKRLLIGLFYLCATTLFAANPAYENFATNHFSFVGSGLNKTVRVNTNGVFGFTNTANLLGGNMLRPVRFIDTNGVSGDYALTRIYGRRISGDSVTSGASSLNDDSSEGFLQWAIGSDTTTTLDGGDNNLLNLRGDTLSFNSDSSMTFSAFGSSYYLFNAGAPMIGNGSGLTNLNAAASGFLKKTNDFATNLTITITGGTTNVIRLNSAAADSAFEFRGPGGTLDASYNGFTGQSAGVFSIINGGVGAFTTLFGDGSGITALNASALASGTVPAARLGAIAGITNVWLSGGITNVNDGSTIVNRAAGGFDIYGGVLSTHNGFLAANLGGGFSITTPDLACPLIVGGIGSGSGIIIKSTTGNGTTGADIIFQTGNNGATEPMRIYNSGNVAMTGALTNSVSLTSPLVIGGTTTTSPLTLRSTSGVGTTGADIIFQTGNNGATEAMRILNSGVIAGLRVSANVPTFADASSPTLSGLGFDPNGCYLISSGRTIGAIATRAIIYGSSFNIEGTTPMRFGTSDGNNPKSTIASDSSGNLFCNTNFTSALFTGNGSGLTNVTATITNFNVYAAGTAYSLTTTPALLDFGTTDPSLTINQAGTYIIHANAGIKYTAATYAGAQTATVKLRRTNNTAADLANGGRTVEMPVLTTFTGGDVFALPPIIYTAASGDIIQIFGSVSATPAAGSVDTDSAEIVAVRLY